MKRIIFSVIFLWIVIAVPIPVFGSIVGDGYGIIGGSSGGEEITQPSPQVTPPPVVVQPQSPTSVAPEKPVQEKEENHKEPKKEQKEDIEQVQKPEEKKEVVSENTAPKKNKVTDVKAAVKKEKKVAKEPEEESDPMELILWSLRNETVVDNPGPDINQARIWKVIKIVLSIVVSYLFVFIMYAFLFMPRLYLEQFDKCKFKTFLNLQHKEKGYYIKVPRWVDIEVTDLYREGKIVFPFVKNKIGCQVEVEAGKEVQTYTINRDLPVYFYRKEE